MHMVIVFSKMTYNAQTCKVKTFYLMFLIEYKGILSNPCLLFYRDEEVDDSVIDSRYFVSYNFKSHLLEIQQAVLINSIDENQYLKGI